MSNASVPALVAALLLIPLPAASAGWFSPDPVVVDAPHLRVGDKMLYEQTLFLTEAELAMRRGEPVEHKDDGAVREVVMARILLVEGPSRAFDRFGVEREAESYRIDTLYDGVFANAVRCHVLKGGADVVRVDVLEGAAWVRSWQEPTLMGTLLEGRTTREANTTITAEFHFPCEVSNHLGGRSFVEGDRAPLSRFAPDLAGAEDGELLSEPAAPTEVAGRKALVFRFTAPKASEAALEIVLADGLPVVHSRRVTDPYGHEVEGAETLRGIERGSGPDLAPFRDERLPTQSPTASFAAPEALTFDESAYDLRFPYSEAYGVLALDPRFVRWIAGHPDARLVLAFYAEDMPSMGVVDSEGHWFLFYADAAEGVNVLVSKPSALQGPAGVRLDAPARTPVVLAFGEDEGPLWPSAPPRREADSASLLRAAAAQGVVPGRITQLFRIAVEDLEGDVSTFVGITSTVEASETEKVSHGVYLMADDGGALAAYATRVSEKREGGLLEPPSAQARPASPVTALSLLAGPGVGSGLAVGGAAATGVALFVVLLKFLAVPLFTRLRKDRLLDNPVRARLYERIRAEPGIHLAELEDYLGLGRGGTRHHVDQLVKHRLVIETKDGAFTRYFAAGEVPPDVARREMAMRAGSSRRVYELLRAEPHLSLREAGARLGLSAPSVHRAKKKLEKAGLLPAAPAADVRASSEA